MSIHDKSCTDEEFVRLWGEHHSAAKIAKVLGIAERRVHARRRLIEKHWRIKLDSARHQRPIHYELDKHPSVEAFDVENGVILVGSDAHYWPGSVSTAHKAFVAFIRTMKPVAVILNGDVLDGATISRFPPIGWTDEDKPSLVQELEACKERLTEIEDVCGAGTRKIWTLGNHDGRFETKLATAAPQYSKIHGYHLRDHFPAWKPTWMCAVNDSVMIKHRQRNGIHAAHNNTVSAGKTMVTGHLHSLKVTPYTDYNGTRYGVDTGTLADCYGPQTTDYTEMNPVNWRAGFAVLTFRDGKLMWPEVVSVHAPGVVDFRGDLHEIG